MTRYLKHATNMASQSEAQLNSAERMIQYMDPEPEADHDTKDEVGKCGGGVKLRGGCSWGRPASASGVHSVLRGAGKESSATSVRVL